MQRDIRPPSARTTVLPPAPWRWRCWTAAASARCMAPRETATRPGVICAKVARYAERIHHPDRLTQPLLRTGPKGSGQFRPITWDEALDRVAGVFADVAAKHGSEAVWPLLLRRHDGTGAARRHQPAAPRHALFAAEADDLHVAAGAGLAGRRRPIMGAGSARDGEVRPDRGLGRQSGRHPGQRDDAYQRARGRSAARSWWWWIPTAAAPPRWPTCTLRRAPAPMARWPAR